MKNNIKFINGFLSLEMKGLFNTIIQLKDNSRLFLYQNINNVKLIPQFIRELLLNVRESKRNRFILEILCSNNKCMFIKCFNRNNNFIK